MAVADTACAGVSRAEIEARLSHSFLTLNQIASSLAVIERSCSRALETLPIASDAGVDHALALRTAASYAQLTLERIGDISDTLSSVARYLRCLKRGEHDAL
jgi:hypothetical protein